jgi:hypothetical protein
MDSVERLEGRTARYAGARMTPLPPNPWLTLGGIPSPRVADVPYSPVVAASAASTNAAPLGSGPLPSGEVEPSVTMVSGGAAARYDEATAGYACCYNCGHREPCDEHCPQSPYWQAVDRIDWSKDRTSFSLDESAFLSEIEPVPAFLSAGREYDEAIDALNRSTDSDIEVSEMERLLELARAAERPAAPMLRRANG